MGRGELLLFILEVENTVILCVCSSIVTTSVGIGVLMGIMVVPNIDNTM